MASDKPQQEAEANLTPLEPVIELLSRFEKLEATYRTSTDDEVPVYILVPKETSPNTSSVPLFVRFHGGGLVTGEAMFSDWMAAWNLSWPLSYSGVMVLPDYRLLPEANGADMLDDITSLWRWIGSELQNEITSRSSNPITVNLDQTIIMGASAGGYHGVQCGFYASKIISYSIKIRGIILPYPMIDLEDPWYTVSGHRSDEKFIGIPTMPKSIIDDLLHRIREKRQKGDKVVVTSVVPPERLDLMVAAFQHGAYGEFLLGNLTEVSDDCYPIKRLQTVESFPPVLILHGLQDGAVTSDGSTRFIDELRKRLPLTPARLELHPGDHNFDKDLDHRTGWFGIAMKWFEEKSQLRLA